MQLKNNLLQLKVNNQGEIISLKFHDQEILHQGQKWWKKTFPIIWPVLSYSNGFIIKNKNYKIPKHGFWNQIKWDYFFENEQLVLTGLHLANEIYPFTIDIQQYIKLVKNKVIINTIFTNVSRENAYFAFGYHPAFIIDNQSQLKYKSKEMPYIISLDGSLAKEQLTIKDKKIIDLPFGEKFDTLVFKNSNFKVISFESNKRKISMKFDAPNLQIWQAKNSLFICLEPWYGVNDLEKNQTHIAKEKEGIIELASGKTWSGKMELIIN